MYEASKEEIRYYSDVSFIKIVNQTGIYLETGFSIPLFFKTFS